MNRGFEFSTYSVIPLKRKELWLAVTTMKGVNYELAPFVKMTVPRAYQDFTIEDAPINEKLFKSIIFFFKFIPVDIHHFRLEKVIPNEKFEENSTSLMHYFWKHTRILTIRDEGTQVKDIIQFQPRLPLIGYILKPIYQFIFNNRHRRLKQKYQFSNK